MNKIISKVKEVLNKLVDKVGSKKAHVICTFLITLLFGTLGIISGILMGCIASVGKEVYSHVKYVLTSQGSGFNKQNLVYDVIGIAIAVVILVIL